MARITWGMNATEATAAKFGNVLWSTGDRGGHPTGSDDDGKMVRWFERVIALSI